MKKRVSITLVILLSTLLAIMPVVIAIKTTVNINTLPDHDVVVDLFDPFPKDGESNMLEGQHYEGVSSSTGEVSFEITSGKSQVNIRVIVEKDGKRIQINDKYFHLFENKATGSLLNLNVKEGLGVVDPVVDEVEEEVVDEEVEEESEDEEEGVKEINEEPVKEEEIIEEESAKITGKTIGVKSIVSSKTLYYIIGIIVAIVVLGFVIHIGRKKMGTGGSFKVRKFSSTEDELSDAENKLDSAKKELDDIRDRKKKLNEAKEKFNKDKEELSKLESEE